MNIDFNIKIKFRLIRAHIGISTTVNVCDLIFREVISRSISRAIFRGVFREQFFYS